MKEKLQFTGNNYFCGAKKRPECVRFESKQNPGANVCCLYCEGETIERCIEHNRKLGLKIKPCTADIISPDEYCELSI